MKTPVILLVDDENTIVNSLRGSLEDEGYIVLTASDGMKAMEIIKFQPVDIVFLDIWLPEMDGMTTLTAIKDFDSDIDVVMMTGHGTVNTAVQAVKQGAFDFLEKPFSLDTVINIIKKVTEKQKASTTAVQPEKPVDEEIVPDLTGETPAVLVIKEEIGQLATHNEHIFLQGELGSGKELIAWHIHAQSKKDAVSFIKINCSFYSPQELEVKLFGSHKSKEEASAKQGILQNTSDCTVFLEAVDALPVKLQKRITKSISSSKHKESGMRIIAATIKDPDDIVEAGVFQPELLECFSHTLRVPALRHRRSDIPLLLTFFISQFCEEYGFREKHLEDDAVEILVNYDWPGNVKEVKNLAEKLVVSVPTKNISAHDIPLSLRDDMQSSMARFYERYKSFEEAEAAWRKNYILYHLRKNDKDVKKTSKKLYIKEKNLKKYIKEYGIVFGREKKTRKRLQRTLKRSMVMSGRGLHSGDKTGLMLTPLPPNSGIIFGSISSGETIPADIDYVVSTDYATCLQSTNTVARTTEHFLAALHAYRITNLMIKINNEVPIMDGSAVDFCQIIEDAGIEEQDEELEEIVITDRYTVGDVNPKSKFVVVEPSEKFSIHYTLRYPKPIGVQEFTFVLDDEEVFKNEIAPARTFGFVKDIEALSQKGLADGGRLNNFILIDDEKIINTDLRFPDEFVRHKILDMMGDLYLLGRPIKGKITANMTGHGENATLVRMIRDNMHL